MLEKKSYICGVLCKLRDEKYAVILESAKVYPVLRAISALAACPYDCENVGVPKKKTGVSRGGSERGKRERAGKGQK